MPPIPAAFICITQKEITMQKKTTTPTGNLLAEKAMLASLNVCGWTARRYDRKVSDEVNQKYNASADAGRYNKLLLAKEAIAPLTSIGMSARRVYHEMTQPWLNDGSRILPSALYLDLRKKMDKFEGDYNEAADKFARDYPKYLADARKRLNGMFNADDYPAAASVRGLFSLKLSIMPCPDVNDFRVSISKEQADDIRESMAEDIQRALDQAMKEPARRILEVVGKMAERLSAYKPATKKGDVTEGQFRDTLVTNVRELVDLLPAFNLRNDPVLTQITARMQRELCSYDGEELRTDAKVRATVRKQAEKIIADVNDFMA
jgi:hypothetical protein